jgi:FMN phosphatase YigB (HAD superfamily)
MENGQIKAVVFDLGNVLIDFDHRIAAGKIASFTAKAPEEIFRLFFDSPLTADFESGKIPPQEFFCQVKKLLGLKIGYAQFVPIWNEIFFVTDKNRAVYELAVLLRRKFKVGLLSNINILHLDYLQKNFSVFDVFDKIITSCELGVQKPDAVIYSKAVEALGADFRETFYTDDRPELVEQARALGIRGFVFRGVAQLEADLKSQGIIIE